MQSMRVHLGVSGIHRHQVTHPVDNSAVLPLQNINSQPKAPEAKLVWNDFDALLGVLQHGSSTLYCNSYSRKCCKDLTHLIDVIMASVVEMSLRALLLQPHQAMLEKEMNLLCINSWIFRVQHTSKLSVQPKNQSGTQPIHLILKL